MSSPFDSQYDAIRNKIIYYADQWGIPRDVAIWQIWYESTYNPNAVSPAGAKGIAQFMPATAARFGVDVWDIDSSLDGWGEYMSWLLRQPYINGNIGLALAGYNAGEGNVQKYHGVPPFAQTQDYVKKILGSAGQVITTAAIGPLTNSVDNILSAIQGFSESDTTGQAINYTPYIIGGAALFTLLVIFSSGRN